MYDNDPRVRAFLRQAVAIIAMHRGLTPVSQAQLKSLAEYLRLEPKEWDWALVKLQETLDVAPALTRYEQAFTDYLNRKFTQLSQGVLPLKVENRAVDIAVRKFQIGPVQARHLIDLVCEVANVKRISKSDAEKFVEQVIVQQLDGLKEIQPGTRERINELGRQWGVDSEQVAVLVDRNLQENRRAINRNKRVRWTYTLGLFAVACSSLVSIAVIANRRSAGASQLNEASQPAVDPEQMEPRWWPKLWMDENRPRLVDVPGVVESANNLRTQDAEQRVKGYEQLALAILNLDNSQRELGEQLLVELLNHDEEREIAGRWLGSFCQPLTSVPMPIYTREESWKEQLKRWQIVDLIYSSYLSKDAKRSGSDPPDIRLSRQLVAKAGGNGDSNSSASETLSRLQRTWIMESWNRLAQCSQAELVIGLLAFDHLRALSKEILSPTILEALQRQAVQRFIELDERSWSDLKPQIQDALATGGAISTDYWIRVWRGVSDTDLKDWLGQELIANSGQPTVGLSKPQILSAVEELRVRRLRNRNNLLFQLNDVAAASEAVIRKKLDVAGSGQPQFIAEIVAAANQSLAVLRNLAVARGDKDKLTDAIADMTSPESTLAMLSVSDSLTKELSETVQPVPTPSDRRVREQSLSVLKGMSDQNRDFRKTAIDKLHSVADRLNDLTPSDATVLANYFLSDLSIDEWVSVERRLSGFRHWPTFALAVCDQLETTEAARDQVLTLIQILADRQYQFADDGNWRSEGRRVLFDATLVSLTRKHLSNDEMDGRQWDRLAAVTTELYGQRLRLVDLEKTGLGPAFTPSRLAHAIAANLEVGQNSGVSINMLNDWIERHHLGELSRTVVWCEILADDLLARANAGEGELPMVAIQVQEQRQQRLQSATNLGHALMVHELALFELWNAERKLKIERLIKE